MKLNGWQRLWVVVAVVWMLPVLVLSYPLWPTITGVPKADVYIRMKPDDGRRLLDYNPFASIGGIPDAPKGITQVPSGNDPFAAYGGAALQNGQPLRLPPGATLVPEFTDIRPLPGNEGPVVDIDGHTVQFKKNIPQEDMNQTARAYDSILRHILALKRMAFVGEALASWMVPAVALYALGWAIGWVRRGFGTNRLGRAG
jgi:hypothetical protein